ARRQRACHRTTQNSEKFPPPHPCLRLRVSIVSAQWSARYRNMKCWLMSALGQNQTCALQNVVSALHAIATAKAKFRKRPCLLHPKADMCSALVHVCFGPKADMCGAISV